MRATGFRHRDSVTLPPIRATIVAGENDVGVRISDQGEDTCPRHTIAFLRSAGGGLLSASIQSPSDLFSFSHIRNATRMDDNRLGALRSASSRGVRATVAEQVGGWQANETERAQVGNDPEREAGIAPHQRIGLGLPMSNIFATWVIVRPFVLRSGFTVCWTGTLEAPLSWYLWTGGVSDVDFVPNIQDTEMLPVGTDVFLRLPKLVSGVCLTFDRHQLRMAQGTNLEGIEV
jgi:hypothetical protein